MTQGKGKDEGKLLGGWPNTANSPTIRANPLGEVYEASNWALKTNESSLAKQMPLVGEFPSYIEWGKEARRWDKTLYNHPVSSVIDYFVVNLSGSTNRVDSESGGELEI